MKEITLHEKTVLSPIMKDVYRRIRTNIEFTGVDNKVICVTSCGENDGKTSVSFNLAKSFAENGKRVLFIDADMRNSVLPARMDFPNNLVGLSHYLAGINGGSECIYSTNIKKLYMIPTGRFAKNPTELLSKEVFSNLLSGMKQNFDYIIVDTPPLGPVVDAAVVAKASDASVLVLSPNTVSHRVALGIVNQLKGANPNFLGVIMNKMEKTRGGKGYGYGYGYSYGYGYGYGNTQE